MTATEAPLSERELRPLYIEGYTDRQSYRPGETVGFHVSTSADAYSMEIARLGAEREVVWSQDGLKGAAHPIPEDASSNGCRWPAARTLEIPGSWRSGVYRATLRAEDSGGKFVYRSRRTAESSLHFVVRSARPGRDCKILLQLASNSYNAYNNWGGSGLYFFHGRNGLQGSKVSFHRPCSGGYFDRWEHKFIRWAEANGYALDYAVNLDLELHPEELSDYRLVLSVGHDEYWSSPMRDHLEAHIEQGGNAAFFAGNAVCWQVRATDEGNALVCWKQLYNMDPLYHARGDLRLLTTAWSHHLVGRPENHLTGVGFLWGGYHLSHGQYMDGSGAFTVHRPDHWLFEGTGLRRGDEFGGKDTIVGYECDGCEMTERDGLPYPTGNDGTPANFEILGTAPARWHPADCEWYDRWEKGREGAAVLGAYVRGGTVVTTGTTDWADGLAGNDPVVARITRNILDRLGR